MFSFEIINRNHFAVVYVIHTVLSKYLNYGKPSADKVYADIPPITAVPKSWQQAVSCTA